MTDQKNSALVLVVGATGALGSEIVNLCVESGHRVRALVRPVPEGVILEPPRAYFRDRIEQLPVEMVTGDLKDPASLEEACRDVDYVVSTATTLLSKHADDSIEEVDRDGHVGVLAAAERAGARHMTFISFVPSELEYEFQSAKRAVEEALRDSNLTHTIIQASAFMEVWLSPIVGFDPLRGKVRVFGEGTQPVSWVSAFDVARFAAATVGRPRFENVTLALGGPEALSAQKATDIFAALLGKNIHRESVPEQAILDMLQSPDERQKALAASMLVTARGQTVDSTLALSLLPGKMKSVRTYALDLIQKGLRG